MRNPSLQLQHKLTDFDHIGVYVKFPDHISASLSHSAWETIYPDSPNPDFELHRFFSLAVELVCLERCLTACHDLRVAGALLYRPIEELKIVDTVTGEFPRLVDFGQRPSTFLTLAQLCRTIVREMNQACGRGTVKELGDRLPPRDAGEILKFVTEKITAVIQMPGSANAEIGFKFCLDDCEVLSPIQQRSLNTLVRISNHPISWVVSSVGSFFDTSETFIEQQPLTDHDRKIVRLDLRTAEEFKALCQAVLSLRLYFAVSEEAKKAYEGRIEQFFPLDIKLGSRDINDLFAAIIDESESPYAKRLAVVATSLRAALRSRFKSYRRAYPPRTKDLPYYQTYVLLLSEDGEDAFKSEFGPADERRLLSGLDIFEDGAKIAWLRRKQAAALLHFASRLGFKRLAYGGVPMIAQLADGSVRDFLEIVGEIFDAYCHRHNINRETVDALDRFAASRTEVAAWMQERGIYNASTSYLSGISNRSELDASIVTKFIDGLGYFTANLQSNWHDPTTLGRAERGVFTVRFPDRTKARSNPERQANEDIVWNVIRQAELAGYIRTSAIQLGAGVKPSEGEARNIKFRLHHRFAPHYRFSHRGAYETVAIQVDDLAQLLDRNNQIDSAAWGQRMAARLGGGSGGQLDLDLSIGVDDV
ncbi:hypothetical protein HHL08_21675 [Sphingobium sp. AR-3-1]|uniref:Uncharacterized protein n=2 Tax=Sphingobium TaxID=165695 RepID=A0A7X9WZG9_9SPHN|nr:hypothetical protein [Sphingobium psychrophilum]NML12709.1 hypothetical protein [Sphingobium psychrophilum]